ncbi:glycosyltransferase family 87 protein [Sneathiella litorea]|uniref:DUF2029 domain-containing protein n=1 Tax=Sneathiella litorea TaxID=2606216 RepID=A0A6L8WB84_9PROT|nr:glycosyltransferase family 87 protein [Sneathiella litorea]MZR31722.1 DUF2029 domain-containing protein [Sneathiella litorea]
MSELNFRARESNPATIFIYMVGSLITISLLYEAVDHVWGSGEAIKETWTVLQLIIVDDDSWWPMYNAAKVWIHGHEIYQTIFFEERMKFQYPPLSILPFIVLIKLGLGWEAIREIANTLSYASIFILAVFIYEIIVSTFKNLSKESYLSWRHRVVIFAISLVGTFGFDAIIRAQYLGQVQVLLDVVIGLAFLLFLTNRKYFSGACLAVAALVKPQFTLVLFWALLRKEKELVVGMILVFIPAGIVSLYVFGFDEHVHYLDTLSLMGKHGEAYWPNQSINGLLHRLLSDVNSLEFPVNSYAPYNPIVHVTTLVTTVMLILLGLFYRVGNRHPVSEGVQSIWSALDLATMLLLATIASPIAWYHHYGILWPLFVATFVVVACYSCKKKRDQSIIVVSWLLGISFLLISNRFPAIASEPFSSSPINLLQSYYLFGAFLMLAVLLILRRYLAGYAQTDQAGV